MVITTTDQTSNIINKKHIYLKVQIRGITYKRVPINSAYMISTLNSDHDLIVEKNSIVANLYIVDLATNTL
jgi:hypothetical protein